MTDAILTVHRVGGTPGDRYVTCPHCMQQVNLPSGPVRGEQFQHRIINLNGADRGCMGWFDVAPDAHLARAE